LLPTFQRAMQRRSIRIAGATLGPLTLAQAYCLHAWESPFVCGGQINVPDFAVALWTCANDCYPFERFTDAVVRGKPDRWMTRLGRRYDMRMFSRDVKALQDWVAWHCQTPPRFAKADANKRGGSAPWPLIVAVQVIPLLGVATTWTAPVPVVMAYKIALDNASGDTSWKSEAEEAQGYANGSDSQSDK
jgi:hypothetical protein